MMIWAALTSRLAGPVATGVAAALAISLAVVAIQKHALSNDLDDLQGRFDTQVDQLATCRASNATLTGAIADRNKQIQKVADDGRARIAQARREVDVARQQTVAANSRLNRLLSTPTAGTVCERTEQVDRAILESFQ